MAPRFELILIFQSGQLEGQRAKMQGDRMVIGSAEYCDLQLQEPGVSRQHAVIRFVGDQYVIADLGSRNGVFVNGKRLTEPKTLYHKDKIAIGEVRVRIRIPGTQTKPIDYDPEKLTISADDTAAPKASLLNKRVIIYGGAGLMLLGLVLLMQEPKPEEANQQKTGSTESDAPGTSEDAAAVIKEEQIKATIIKKQEQLGELLVVEAEKEREQIERALQSGQKVPVPEQHKLAREKFERGMRELRAKHFIQAEREFNLALSLNAKDPLIAEYLTRTRRKRRSVAAEHYELAKAYFSSLRYDLSVNHFQKVLELLEIEKKTLDNESSGYVEIMKNVDAYLKRVELEKRK